MSWPGAFALAAICAGFAAIAWAESYSNAATSLATKAAADLAIENSKLARANCK